METRRDVAPSGSLRDLLAVIFRFRRTAIASFLLVFVVGAAISLATKPVYEAKAKLLVKIGREYVNRSDLNSPSPMMSLNQGEIINSEVQILRNDDSIKKTIEAVGLQRMYPDLSRKSVAPAEGLGLAVQRFQKALTVEGVKQSNVLEVSFKHTNRAIAAQAVNILTELYKEKHLQVLSGPRSTFVDQQVSQYQQELQRSEEKLQSFKLRTNISSLTEQRTLLLQQRGSLGDALNKTHADILELEQKVPALKSNLQSVAHSTARYAPEAEARIDETRNKLLALQLEEQQLLKKYTDINPLVIGFRKQIAVVKRYLKEQESALSHRTNAGSPMYQTLQLELVKAQADLASLKGREQMLREQLKQTDNEVAKLNANESDLQQLKREQAVAQKNFETLVGKAEEVRLSETMDRNDFTNISVIERAFSPLQPVGSTKRENLLRTLVMALVAGIALPFAMHLLSPHMATPETAERRLGLRVLATISYDARA